MNEHTPEFLKELQSMPMEAKVFLTQARIIEFYGGHHPGMGYGNAYVSFSGGKDSTVLLDIARKIYPEIPAAFSNTGLEYPEIRQFAKAHDNVEVVTPKMPFNEVISRYGYPLIGKEVAEAIYYARRIAGSERDAPNTHTHKRADKPAPQDGTQRHTAAKRTELQGKRQRNGRAGVNGLTGEGGAFSNAKERFGEKSQFNKEKWLPLARDTQFNISHYCCSVIKKRPLKAYAKRTERHPILATMAEESRIRKQAWLRTGCNAFEGKEIKSQPMSFWTEQDVLLYIVKNDIEICSVYGNIVAVDEVGNEYDPKAMLTDGCKLKCTGCERTGCMFCGFGFHLEKGQTRFQRLALTHPKQYEYCLGGGQWVDNPDYDPAAPKFDGVWENWNPKKIWVPSKKGLGMKYVFDACNEIYGKSFYRYE